MRRTIPTYTCPKCKKKKNKWIKEDFTSGNGQDGFAKIQGICKDCFMELMLRGRK